MLNFSKLVGTGNDFIFVDLTKISLAAITSLSKEELAQKICDRHFGVGADGIIFVEKASNPKATEKLKWNFFNRDGSQAEFCGNAARCFGRWANHFYKKNDLVFESRIGDVQVLIDQNTINVRLHKLSATPSEIMTAGMDFLGIQKTIAKLSHVFLINSGVPHFVCMSPAPLSRDEKLQLVSVFRFHQTSGAAGANVTFLSGDETVTFERGVEDFTLSCGTGFVAAAICSWKSSRHRDILLRAPGGTLKVEIVESSGDTVTKANLIGPANLICEGIFNLASLPGAGRLDEKV